MIYRLFYLKFQKQLKKRKTKNNPIILLKKVPQSHKTDLQRVNLWDASGICGKTSFFVGFVFSVPQIPQNSHKILKT